MTIAATYTTAVIGMAVLKGAEGTLLEENTAGPSARSGAISPPERSSRFRRSSSHQSGIRSSRSTLCAVDGHAHLRRYPRDHVCHHPPSGTGGKQGASLSGIDRRSGDPQVGTGGCEELAPVIHGMGVGAFLSALVEFKVIAAGWQKLVGLTKGTLLLRAPGMNPAYFGVGYIIGPRLGAINFSGGVLAWGCSHRSSPISFIATTPPPSPTGPRSSPLSGKTTCGTSLSGECSSAPSTLSTGCEAACSAVSHGRSRISGAAAGGRGRCGPNGTSTSGGRCSSSVSSSSS